MLLTIFTPTYNRAKTIVRTYESLQRQDFKDFEWLIVDDGSMDETELVVREFLDRSDFPIRYIKKTNGGKHTAYNLALETAQGELFFTVDSDDWLPDGSLRLIEELANRIMDEESVAGIIALKEDQNLNVIGKPFKRENYKSTFRELELAGEGGERSIVFKTAIAKRYIFPIINNERFMTEGVVYDEFKKYKFLVSNQSLTICEYQQDGLSSSPKRLMIKNPGGYMLYYRNRIDMAVGLKERIGYAMRYNLFKHLYSGTQVEKYAGPHSLLVGMTAMFNLLVRYYYTLGINK